MMLRYRVPLPRVKPFVEAGYAPRVINGSVSSDLFVPFSPYLFPAGMGLQHSNTPTNWAATYGVVVGAGVQFTSGRLRLSPGVRYTHWNTFAILGYYSDGPSWQSTQNQFDVLLTIGWRLR